MKWLTNLENIVGFIVIGLCQYFDKSNWILLLLIPIIMNIMLRINEEGD